MSIYLTPTLSSYPQSYPHSLSLIPPLTAEGRVYAWGAGTYGQLGLGEKADAKVHGGGQAWGARGVKTDAKI